MAGELALAGSQSSGSDCSRAILRCTIRGIDEIIRGFQGLWLAVALLLCCINSDFSFIFCPLEFRTISSMCACGMCALAALESVTSVSALQNGAKRSAR